LTELIDQPIELGRLLRRDDAGAIAAQHHRVREPVRHEGHHQAQRPANQQSLISTDHLAADHQQRKETRQQDEGLRGVDHCSPPPNRFEASPHRPRYFREPTKVTAGRSRGRFGGTVRRAAVLTMPPAACLGGWATPLLGSKIPPSGRATEGRRAHQPSRNTLNSLPRSRVPAPASTSASPWARPIEVITHESWLPVRRAKGRESSSFCSNVTRTN